jgi:phosphate transport system substrate-binding protein
VAQEFRGGGFTGSGSTLVQPLMQRWGQVFSAVQGDGGDSFSVGAGLDYEPIGSLGGISRAIQRAVEFGASDVPLPAAELDRFGLAQFPIAFAGIAIVTNIQGVPTRTLRLDGATLARIYLGEITRWSDPAIRALNPGTTLPDVPIAVVHRSDGSGTTYNVARFLTAQHSGWRERVGVDQVLRWPTGTGVEGSRRLAERVQATQNAIGYVEAGQAASRNLAVALIRNAAGQFAAPTEAGLRALADARWDVAQHFYALPEAGTGAEAYPIPAIVFALMPREPRSTARMRLALDFFRFALTERAEDALALGFVPLPEATVQQVTAYWRTTIRGAR